MHGTYTANMAVAESDLLVAIGVRFDDRVTGKLVEFAPNADVVHIDIDASNVGKIRKPQYPVIADARVALELMAEMLGSKGATNHRERLSDWWSEIREWQKAVPLSCEYSEFEIKPQQVIETLHEVTNGDAVIVSDVGQHQMWAAQFIRSSEAGSGSTAVALDDGLWFARSNGSADRGSGSPGSSR